VIAVVSELLAESVAVSVIVWTPADRVRLKLSPVPSWPSMLLVHTRAVPESGMVDLRVRRLRHDRDGGAGAARVRRIGRDARDDVGAYRQPRGRGRGDHAHRRSFEAAWLQHPPPRSRVQHSGLFKVVLDHREPISYSSNALNNDDALDRVFNALAHPTRRALLRRVARKQHTVSELAEPFDVSLEAVSQHLRVLERAGLVTRSRRGREHHFRFEPSPLRRATKVIDTLARFWERRLDELDAFLAEDDNDAS
jgi:DNA-binding transcriptional ArsR family regulator